MFSTWSSITTLRHIKLNKRTRIWHGLTILKIMDLIVRFCHCYQYGFVSVFYEWGLYWFCCGWVVLYYLSKACGFGWWWFCALQLCGYGYGSGVCGRNTWFWEVCHSRVDLGRETRSRHLVLWSRNHAYSTLTWKD